MLPNYSNSRKPTIGDCECCDKVNVEVWTSSRNMTQCADCKAADEQVEARSREAAKLIQDSRQIDSAITLKTDIFLSKTVAAVELKAAIDNDDSIPAAEKNHAYARECMVRFLKLRDVILPADRAAITEKENEMRMWQVNVQTMAGKLRADQRAQFREVDFNYQPAPITKRQKTTKPVKTPKFDKVALFEAAKKYGVPANNVQSIITSKGMTAENAAKYLAELMGLL